MRFLLTLTLLAVGIGAFMFGTSRPAADTGFRRAAPRRPRRRIPPEQTAHAAAERWYDEV